MRPKALPRCQSHYAPYTYTAAAYARPMHYKSTIARIAATGNWRVAEFGLSKLMQNPEDSNNDSGNSGRKFS